MESAAYRQGWARYFEYGLDYHANPYEEASVEHQEFEYGMTQGYRRHPEHDDELKEKRERHYQLQEQMKIDRAEAYKRAKEGW